MRRLLKLIKQHPSIAIGAAALSLLCIIALLAPWLGTIAVSYTHLTLPTIYSV